MAYPQGGPVYTYQQPPKTNGLAIASLVCSLFFWMYAIPGILAIIFGFIARSQIQRSGGTQGGSGMALAGIIIGFAGLAIGIVLVIVIAAAVNHCNQTGNCGTTFNTG